MTSVSKPDSKFAVSREDLRGVSLYRVAIVGAASLKGKEVADVLRERNFPAVDVRLLDDDESLGRLEAVGDEMNFIQSIGPIALEPAAEPSAQCPGVAACPSCGSPARGNGPRPARFAQLKGGHE